MNLTPIHEQHFYRDGRGPELRRIHWKRGYPLAFDYYNPDDTYEESNLKHLALDRVEAYAMASEEVHGSIVWTDGSSAAIHIVDDSPWRASFNPRHLEGTDHYQVMFYDEIFDLICAGISCKRGGYVTNDA